MQEKADRVANPFVHRSAAQRYAAARPYFHPQVIRRIAVVTRTRCFERALDIGCGTGQSSRALAKMAKCVDAIDVSAEMLSEAEPHPRVRYQLAAAEEMPFPDACFELATVGLAYHWFDQPAFLNEARRVLRPGSWLVVYDSRFSGEMVENGDFRLWASEAYVKRFPGPPRRSAGISTALAGACGFTLAGEESFAHHETMTAEQLSRYLLTHTNVIAAVESGETPLSEAAAWIKDGVRPFFAADVATIGFSGKIWFLRRTAAA